MIDHFSSYQMSLESPASNLSVVTPSDTTDLPHASRALNVSTSGNVQITTIGDDTVTVFVAAGGAFPIRAKRIWATDTTALDIVAMY